jgi:hypothetical protein
MSTTRINSTKQKNLKFLFSQNQFYRLKLILKTQKLIQGHLIKINFCGLQHDFNCIQTTTVCKILALNIIDIPLLIGIRNGP